MIETSAAGCRWSCGVDRDYLSDLAEYWLSGYDWREHEARLNRVPQFRGPGSTAEISNGYTTDLRAMGCVDVEFSRGQQVLPDPSPDAGNAPAEAEPGHGRGPLARAQTLICTALTSHYNKYNIDYIESQEFSCINTEGGHMSVIGLRDMQILRGLSSDRSLLSCSSDGTVVNLWNEDDGSGRQFWDVQLVPGSDDLFHITVSKGVTGDRRFLSCFPDGSGVDLWAQDDGSGRQRWQIAPVPGTNIPSYYHVTVSKGVTGDRRFLSCFPDGSGVDLWAQDDASGRQRWQLQ